MVDEIAALRAQLAKKDRQIAKLKTQIASADERAERAYRQKFAAGGG
jgi:chromosome segregation ATPase